MCGISLSVRMALIPQVRLELRQGINTIGSHDYLETVPFQTGFQSKLQRGIIFHA